MPYINRNKQIEDRVQKYLKEYELDDLNTTNDLESLRQMCALELLLEKYRKDLFRIDGVKNSNQVKSLNTAIKDATNAYTTLQQELAIDRRKRRENDSNKDSRIYINTLQEQASKVNDSRSEDIVCSSCGQKLGSLYIAVKAIGAELGSIEAMKNPPQDMKYTCRIQCHKCAGNHPMLDSDNRWKQTPPTESFGSVHNEDTVIVDKEYLERLENEREQKKQAGGGQ
jgi:hypothetical protein